MHTALTIAGSDPSGGAGLQADLKTFHQHGVYGMAVVTLITVQNTKSVTRVDVLDAELVRQQVEAVLTDIPPNAIKTGALGNAAVINAVADALRGSKAPLVVDPVMISKHGHALLAADAQSALINKLLPITTLLTPNTHEARALLGREINTLEHAEAAARELVSRGPKAVLVKGGHLDGAEAIDVLFAAGQLTHFRAPRIETKHTHGTGCTYASAIAAGLALGKPLAEAIAAAKNWLTSALRTAPGLGAGIGPVNHLAR
ncbi:MAG: bifunctional hydroxymethylpyrimidine kinase/phosphomethylpyrimidine kinase [Archangium sp.]|nr:bifunctional hydroxymethylpyrimidine kinase/phosphomethylpyrimidine kinase [Archangium sp.]